MNKNNLQTVIEAAWQDRELLKQTEVRNAIAEVMKGLDEGALRVAEPEGEGVWKVNEWVKQAVLLNFPIQSMTTMEVGPFEFHDKMPLKKGYAAAGVRVVPHAVVRYGAHVARDCILMPSYVNLGAYVGEVLYVKHRRLVLLDDRPDGREHGDRGELSDRKFDIRERAQHPLPSG